MHLFFLAKNRGWKLFYVKENDEVDFIIKNKDVMPVEVKYRRNIKDGDVEKFQRFLTRNKLKKGIMVTRDLFDVTGNIILLPAWYFLLLK